MKKFWKYQAMQRAAMSRSGDESLVFSLVLPVDSSQRVQAHHGDTSDNSGQKTKVLPSPSNDSECQPSSRHRGGHPEAAHLTPTRQGPPPSHADNRRLIIPSQLSQVPDAVLSTPQQNDEDNESGDETPHSTSSETYKRITDLRRNKQNEDNGKPIESMDKQEMLQQSVFEACAQGDLVLLQERLEGQDEDKILFLLYTAQSQDNEYSALHYASENGDETTLKWLLLKYKEWNALDIIYVQDHLGYTPLHFLCAGGHVNVLRFIRSDVAGGPTAPIFFGNVRSHDDTSLVHTCVLHAQHDTLMWLFMDNSRPENMNFALEGPLEVNSVNETGACPLHIACALSDIRMARLLVGRGAFVNIIDVNGNTPLFVSCFTNDLIMVQWLYAQGATYSQYNKKGFSALHIASRKGNGNLARWLITNGLGDFKLKSDVLGVSPMDEARLNSHENVYNMFLEMQEAEDEVQSRHADFFSCVQEGRVFDAVEALEVDGVDVDSVLAGGNTALHIACSTGCFEMAEVLVSRYGAEVDTPHIGTGMTPLHVACVHNNDLLVQWLVQRGGANPMTQCWQGNTVFHYVCQAGSMMLVQWFVELGSVDINVSNIDGFTALYMACKHGFINIAKYLVDCGAYPYTSNAYGMTLLHASAGGGKEDITNWLLQTFHDYILVDAQNYNGCTAFYLACASGHLAVAKALYQASPSVLDVHAFAVEDNNSALHIACKNGQLEVVMWLVLELGLHQDLFDALNKRMCSPVQVAKDMNKLKVVEWITMQQPSISVVENDGKRKTKKKKKIKISLSETQVPEQEENADGSDDDDVNSDVVNKVVEKRKPFASFFACMPVNNFGEVKAGVVNGKQERSNNSTSSHANYSKPNIESVTEFSEETNSEALEIYDFINEHDARSIEKRLRSKSKDDIKRILNHVLRDHGRTVIHEACTVADSAVLKALLSTVTKDHVDLNIAERFNGNSPLHILCRHDDSLQVEAILLLLSLGADIGTKNRDGETPMHLLCSFPNKESACKVVQTIIELPRTVLQHLDLAVKNTAGLSLMHVAVRANNLPLVRLLCQYSQSLVNSRSETHVTPLHMASMYGFYEIADTLLVQFDAFVNARDDDGMTALLFACRNGHLRIAKLAVKHGANVFVEEDVAGTALHFACSAGDFAMTKWLVRQGLRPDTENNDGVSPEQVAQDQLREVKAAIVESSDDELRDKEADLVRVTNWLAAWSLADKMGLPVEEVLAEMSIEQNGSKNAAVIGKRRTIH
jgi:ankyrin repeat protein